jgi:hypothetical protein
MTPQETNAIFRCAALAEGATQEGPSGILLAGHGTRTHRMAVSAHKKKSLSIWHDSVTKRKEAAFKMVGWMKSLDCFFERFSHEENSASGFGGGADWPGRIGGELGGWDSRGFWGENESNHSVG